MKPFSVEIVERCEESTVNTIVRPKGIAEAIGPFSRAILIDGHLYIAGTTALAHQAGILQERTLPDTIEEQTRLTLENIRKCVEAVNGTMDDIYKIVVMIKDFADYERMNKVRADYFKKSPPVSSCFKAEFGSTGYFGGDRGSRLRASRKSG